MDGGGDAIDVADGEHVLVEPEASELLADPPGAPGDGMHPAAAAS